MSPWGDVLIFLVAQVVFVVVFGLVWFAGVRVSDGWDLVDRE